MAEIKYRGTIPSIGEKLEVLSIDWMHDEVYLDQYGDSSYSIGEVSLEMATDFYDVNGVRIYEGDELIKIDRFYKHPDEVTEELNIGVVSLGKCSADAQGFSFTVQAFMTDNGFMAEEDVYRIVK